jgi:hypothetical protein
MIAGRSRSGSIVEGAASLQTPRRRCRVPEGCPIAARRFNTGHLLIPIPLNTAASENRRGKEGGQPTKPAKLLLLLAIQILLPERENRALRGKHETTLVLALQAHAWPPGPPVTHISSDFEAVFIYISFGNFASQLGPTIRTPEVSGGEEIRDSGKRQPAARAKRLCPFLSL